jgi:hypothetical protein
VDNFRKEVTATPGYFVPGYFFPNDGIGEQLEIGKIKEVFQITGN